MSLATVKSAAARTAGLRAPWLVSRRCPNTPWPPTSSRSPRASTDSSATSGSPATGTSVCVHDALIDRTSDGRGRVSAMTLAELDRFDFAPRHG